MATTVPSSYSLQQSSPLDTLVRRTSNRRANQQYNNGNQQQPQQQRQPYYQQPGQLQHQQSPPAPGQTYHHPHRILPLKDHSAITPPSPLLHGHFSRASTGTTTTFATYDNRSYLDLSAEDDESVYDAESICSFKDPALRDSWTSPNTVQRPDTTNDRDFEPIPNGTVIADPPHHNPAVPSVVISIASSDTSESPSARIAANRTPITAPRTTNFSRPARSLAGPETPPLPPEDQKRLVLERNRSPGQHSFSPIHSSPLQSNSVHSRYDEQTGYFDSTKAPSLRSPSPNIINQQQQPFTFPARGPSPQPMSSRGPSPQPTYSRGPSPQPTLRGTVPQSRGLSPNNLSPTSPSSPTSYPSPVPTGSSQPSTVLARKPPSLRPSSPTSIYSKYSYYEFNSATPSPTTPTYGSQQSQNSGLKPPVSGPQHLHQKQPSQSVAQEYLQLGIQHHEANRLRESAECFEKSAKDQGGCGVGMLMWGLTLRHGWGCEKNEKVGFKWLSKAAESAVEDLESMRGGTVGKNGLESKTIQDELVLAIYEVGQCFFQGWGVQKDQKMAFSYYSVAARLGDADAQTDLGFCLANGKGCKKDRKEAAKWYREAVKQGVSDIGLAWIYKEKYQ